MSRPALSALRAIEIIDFMSQTPSRAFTLTELVNHTGTNVSSLHSILAVLLSRGYLVRHPVHKAYRLSPALAAIGEAVASSEPILAHAKRAIAQLAARTEFEVILMARTGDDIICLARAGTAPHLRASVRVGQRVPLRPPLGGMYLAWSPEAEIDAWLKEGDVADLERRRRALQLIRERGFLARIHSNAQSELKRVLAAPNASRAKAERETARALKNLEQAMYQPVTIEPEEFYDIDFIGAPIFDHAHEARFTITLQGFVAPLNGQEILRLGRDLIEACGDVMRDSDVHIEPPSTEAAGRAPQARSIRSTRATSSGGKQGSSRRRKVSLS